MMCFRSVLCIRIVVIANKEINHTRLWYLITVPNTEVPYLFLLEQGLGCVLANVQHIHKLFLCNYIWVGLELVFVVFSVVHSSLLIPNHICVNNRCRLHGFELSLCLMQQDFGGMSLRWPSNLLFLTPKWVIVGKSIMARVSHIEKAQSLELQGFGEGNKFLLILLVGGKSGVGGKTQNPLRPTMRRFEFLPMTFL